MASKYERLETYLHNKQKSVENVSLSFKQIDQILGAPLPRSAYTYREWWSNQKDVSNRRCSPKQAREVVGLNRCVGNRRIEAARPVATLENVPQCNTVIRQSVEALLIGQVETRAEQVAHDRPERIPGQRVIFLLLQRCAARHRAENQDTRI